MRYSPFVAPSSVVLRLVVGPGLRRDDGIAVRWIFADCLEGTCPSSVLDEFAHRQISVCLHPCECAERDSLCRRFERHPFPHGTARSRADRRIHKKYNVKQLVYYEFFEIVPEAITREKRLKEWQRAWKARLIKSANPEWLNLFDATTGEIAPLPSDADRADR